MNPHVSAVAGELEYALRQLASTDRDCLKLARDAIQRAKDGLDALISRVNPGPWKKSSNAKGSA